MTIWLLWAGFLASAVAVIVAGTRLARSGDVIAARTRLGHLWVGSVFLAAATSLPELVTDVAAVRFRAIDLAAGDLFGSSMANMLILAVLTLLPVGVGLFRRAALDQVLSGSLAMALSAIAAVVLLIRPQAELFGVGAGSALLVVVYLFGTQAIFRHSVTARQAAAVEEMSSPSSEEEDDGRRDREEGRQALRRAIYGFLVASVAILVAAPLFAASAKRLAEISGLGATFFGTLLVGLATSLPEFVTSLAAVRLKAFDLAVGNLFGSNAVNMAIFVALDLASRRGPVLAVASQTHAISALTAIVLMSIGIAAIVQRAKRRFAAFEAGALTMVVVYLFGLWLVYSASGG